MNKTPYLATVASLLVLAACGREVAPDGPNGANSSARAGQTAVDVDRAWMAAVARGDRAGAGDALDIDFEWTNSEGRTRGKAESLEALMALGSDLSDETEVRTYPYGHVTAITSARPGARMMRVLTRRPEGWRLFAVITTALTVGTTPFAAGGGEATSDCENPCRTMPFTPATENARAIAGVFQQLKMDEWHPNPERWSPFVLDDVYYVTATAQLSKADRVARLVAQKKAGAPSVPGDPVVSMRILDLEDSAVMTARHTPFRGGKPYYSVRVWALSEGRWQLANTQQTVVADAPEARAGS